MRSQVFRIFAPNAWEGRAQLCKHCLVHALLQLNKEGGGERKEEIYSSMSGGTLGNECMELHCLSQALLVCYACNLRMAECKILYTIKMVPTQSHLEMPLAILKQNPPSLFKNSQHFNYAKYFTPQEASGCCIKQQSSILLRLKAMCSESGQISVSHQQA